MNKTDITIWYRIYLPTGDDTDIKMEPFSYRSYDDFADEFTEKCESVGCVDYEPVDWDYIDQDQAYSMMGNSDTWDSLNDLFELAKDYGVPADVIMEAASSMGYSDYKDFMENAFQGYADNLEDYAYELLEDIGITDDMAENYFDYDKFGRDLKIGGDLEMLIMDDWEDRYDTEAEALAVYEEMYDKDDEDVADWYIYDLVGDIQSALGDRISDYFDYKSFARDLGYDGYDVYDGYVFRSY